MDNKKPISGFEYKLREICGQDLSQVRRETEKEERERLRTDVLEQLRKLSIKPTREMKKLL